MRIQAVFVRRNLQPKPLRSSGFRNKLKAEQLLSRSPFKTNSNSYVWVQRLRLQGCLKVWQSFLQRYYIHIHIYIYMYTHIYTHVYTYTYFQLYILITFKCFIHINIALTHIVSSDIFSVYINLPFKLFYILFNASSCPVPYVMLSL